MLAHGTGDAAAGCRDGSNVAAVCNVPTAALLICLQKICADNIAVLFRNEYFMRPTQPILNRGRLVHVAWKRIRFTRPDDGRDDAPDVVLVCVSCGPDQHACSLPRVPVNADGPPIRSGARVSSLD